MINLLIATRNGHKVDEITAILGDGFRCLTLKDFPSAPEVVEDAGTFTGNATKKAVGLAKWAAGQMQSAECKVQNAGPGKQKQTGSGKTKSTRQEATGTAGQEGDLMFVLADDSGLEVDALGGAPGVHSARFAALDSGAAGNSSTAENNAKLLRLLEAVPPEHRTARFRCVIALTPVFPTAASDASPVCSADEHEFQTEIFQGTCEGRIGLAPRGRGGFGYDPLFVPEGFAQTFGELPETTKNQLSHRARALQKLKAYWKRIR